jgi:hypothetical protein
VDEPFLFVFWVLGIEGDGADEKVHSTAELIEQMRDDADYRADQKAFWEHVWRTDCRPKTEALIQLFTAGARYLSDLIGGDVPVLAPRDVVEASVGINRQSADDALLVGKAMQRAIRNQLDGRSQQMTETILAEMQKLLSTGGAGFVPANSKYLDTKQIGGRLGLAPKTVRKLCNQGQIIARKLASGEWRTTEEDLEDSPYLKKKGRRSRAGLE